MSDDPGTILAGWGPGAGAALVGATGTVEHWGDVTAVSRIASISKLIVGFGMLVAVEEGAVRLDDPAGPPGATLRHLMAHASGLGFDTNAVLAPPATRRIYSNTGFETAAAHLEAASGIDWADYVTQAVLGPLAMESTIAEGSPAAGIRSSVADLSHLAAELLSVSLLDRSTLRAATTEQFGALGGVLPGFGLQEPNPWGLAFELRGRKQPHWTGQLNSEATFGHFGGSGTFLWVDPVLDLALVTISGRDFGPWAVDAWPRFSDAVIGRITGTHQVTRVAGGTERAAPQDPDDGDHHHDDGEDEVPADAEDLGGLVTP